VAHDLRSKGVGEEAINAAFHAAGADGAANIESVWRTRFSAAPANERERARQVRFLQGRGFALDTVLRFFREISQ
jgi:regulatory protein